MTALLVFTSVFLFVGCKPQEESSQQDLIFIGWDQNDDTQIFRLFNGGESKQLTDLPAGVLDFSISPNGEEILFASVIERGSSALWKMAANGGQAVKVLDCQDLACSRPVWSPTGERIIYERREINPDGTKGAPNLWWLNVESGDTLPLLEDVTVRGSGASFSPDGSWLSYFAPEDEGIYVYHLEDGDWRFFPNEVGMPAAWNPTSDKIIVSNLDLVIIHGDEGEDHLGHTHDYQSATHLFVGDLQTGELTSLSGNQGVEDSVASWSPDGSQIAFGRRPPRTAAGRQIWIINPDGSNARVLLDENGVNYGPPLWSPDSQTLLFQRFELADPEAYPGIWIFDLETGQSTELVSQGMQPQWLLDNT